MAPETALKRLGSWKEKREKRAFRQVERFDVPGPPQFQGGFGLLKEWVDLTSYGVANP